MKKNCLIGGTFLSIICIRELIDLSYKFAIVPLFEYAGFYDHSDIILGIISWIILILSAPFFLWLLNSDQDRASSVVVQFMYFFSFLPFTSCVRFGLFDMKFIVYVVLFWVFMFLAEYINISINIQQLSGVINSWSLRRAVLIIISTMSILITLYMSYRYTGLRLHFSLLNVYDIREEASGYDIPTVLAYLFGWSRIVNPFMLSYCILKRERVMAIAFAFCSLLSFGFDGSKTVLFFSVIFVIVTIICMIFPDININITLIGAFILISVLSLVEAYTVHSYYFSSFFIRRTMMVENLNSYYYFKFFTTHTPDYFRTGFLRHFGIASDYPDLSKMIGHIYYGNDINANCGLVADAVSNFGLLGVIGYPVMFFALMRMYDKVSEGLGKALKICAGLYISMYLVNTFMIVSLVSHGIIVLLLMIYLVTPISKEGNTG